MRQVLLWEAFGSSRCRISVPSDRTLGAKRCSTAVMYFRVGCILTATPRNPGYFVLRPKAAQPSVEVCNFDPDLSQHPRCPAELHFRAFGGQHDASTLTAMFSSRPCQSIHSSADLWPKRDAGRAWGSCNIGVYGGGILFGSVGVAGLGDYDIAKAILLANTLLEPQ
jgi:hypothetical protein